MFNPANWRIHPKAQQDALEGVLSEVGWVQDVIVNKRTGNLIDGHLRCQVAARNNEPTVPVVYVDLDENEEAVILASLDPLAAMAATDKAKLEELLHEVSASDARVQQMMADVAEKEKLQFGEEPPADVEPQIDKAEELRVKWGVESGQLWQLGEHRIVCGRCNDVEIIKKLNVEEDCILVTDPPYCSGGSQEAQKKSGTWGVIDSDNLSTRGYQTLMKSMIQLFPARAYYIFTDWRMWITLYDLMEGEGQPVRNMIVWAKDNPAMGGIWRTQHELILFASQQNQAKEKGEGSIGNVLTSPRTGNKLHFTQKPTELIEKIITNDSTAVGRGDSVVVDGFLGSGTTLIACERLGRKCRAVEISPAYVAVALQRWADVTGKTPVMLE